MHPALFIDEVLQHVFQFSHEDGLSTLVCASQSCKAWKDPALDYIWSRLSSVIPLLQLIPSLELNNSVYIVTRPISVNELKTFRAYARRVKHIVHKEHVRVDSNLLTLVGSFSISSGVLQHLRSVQVSASNYTTLQKSFALSPQLERLDCHLGFSSRKTFSMDEFCDYIDRATATSSRLQTIAIRGHGLPRLNTTISLLTHLSSLSLRMGNSLLPETVKALVAFPSLLELELHAGHVELNDLLSIGSSITFPVLRKLNVRGHSPVITFLLECLQPHTITTMKLEFEDHSISSESWRAVSTLLTTKAHKSLRSLTIEHHREAQDEDDSQHNSDVVVNNGEEGALILDDTPLSSLCKLTYLCELLLDMVSPPRLYDKDVKTLATWWPYMERLDLGSMATDERCNAPLATTSCLPIFAQSLPNLKQLSIALSKEKMPQSLSIDKPGSCSVLERLYVGCPFPHDAGDLAKFLVSVFPSLKVIDGIDGNWEATQKELDSLRASRDEHSSLLDI